VGFVLGAFRVCGSCVVIEAGLRSLVLEYIECSTMLAMGGSNPTTKDTGAVS